MAIVYLLTNIENGKRYVGKTKRDLEKRWYNHCSHAKQGATYALHRAIRKYGPAAFIRTVLAEFEAEEDALAAEKEWVAKLGTMIPTGYNMCEGGRGAVGFKHSAEQKARRSEREKARWNDPAFRAKQAPQLAAFVAAGATPEARAKSAAAKSTPEARAAISARFKEIHARPGMKAKQGAAISAAKATPEGKARLAEVGRQRSVAYASRTHCRRGHEMTPENTHRPPYAPTTRVCRACEREDARTKHIPKPDRTHCAKGHEYPKKAPGAKQRKCPVCAAAWWEKKAADRKAVYRAARDAGLSAADAAGVRDGRMPMPTAGLVSRPCPSSPFPPA